jgi:hypothetical protein
MRNEWTHENEFANKLICTILVHRYLSFHTADTATVLLASYVPTVLHFIDVDHETHYDG